MCSVAVVSFKCDLFNTYTCGDLLWKTQLPKAKTTLKEVLLGVNNKAEFKHESGRVMKCLQTCFQMFIQLTASKET